jgi:E3 ubiquitin-protein ligase KCMF1
VWVLRGTYALIRLEEVEGSNAEEEEEEWAMAGDELLCPSCGEEFDVVGLYCHIDGEHHAEAKAGVIFFFLISTLV